SSSKRYSRSDSSRTGALIVMMVLPHFPRVTSWENAEQRPGELPHPGVSAIEVTKPDRFTIAGCTGGVHRPHRDLSQLPAISYQLSALSQKVARPADASSSG